MTVNWLSVREVIALHDRLIERFGGRMGVLNEGALESTLMRPQNLAFYELSSSLCDLAAAYGYGLTKNHCFIDGNKRTVFTAMAVFLLRNRFELVVVEAAAVVVMVEIACDRISQEELAIWLSKHVEAMSRTQP